MNKNEKFVITINRELGSGGRTIGRKLAEKLNVGFYDKTLIRELTEKFNLTVEEVEKMKGNSRSWWSNFVNKISVTPTGQVPAKLDMPTTEEMFKVETEILKGIAETASCVIAGRSGFYVFRDEPNSLSILIQASMPFRIERVMRKQNLSEGEARKTIEKVDKMRENYVKKYTGTSRYDTRNYDLIISADGKTEDEIVDIIMEYIG
ncbi:MAG: cytidylate kinase-like family protein [Prevotella sp.]|nr:cytidylate kinase-like family protein [Prevotella sp.]